jgi:2'-5' RNA ligase
VLAIVAYPVLEDADRDWIEAVRANSDPQATRLGVHFTLVFPAESPAPAVVAEASEIAKSTKPIRFSIRHARIVPDVLGDGAHVFLVPDEGLAEIAKLHDRLYDGVMRPHFRADIPFTPHMTIAAGPDLAWCEGVARGLGLDYRTVRGVLRSIDVVNVDLTRVSSLASYALGDSREL